MEVCQRPDGELRLYDPEAQTWLSYLAEEVAARQAAETARQEAESERDAAETARQAAESERDAAETARQEAEVRATELEERLRQHGLLPDQV